MTKHFYNERNHINDLIAKGQLAQAKKSLIELSAKKNLSENARNYLAGKYLYFFSAEKALKLIGPEIPGHKYAELSNDQLAGQMHLAYIYWAVGSNYVCRRIFNNFMQEYLRRKIDINNYIGRFYLIASDIALHVSQVELALDLAQQGLNHYPKDSQEYLLCMSCYLLPLIRSKRFQDAEKFFIKYKAAVKPEDKNAQVGLLGLEGLLFFLQDKFEEAKRPLEQILTMNLPHYTHAYALLRLAVIASKEGKKEVAAKYMDECMVLCRQNRFPMLFAEAVYHFEKIPNNQMSLAQKLVVRCHIKHGPFQYLIGRQVEDARTKIPPLFRDKFIETDNNCWVIRNGDIKAEKYQDIALTLSNKSNNYLDLFSGVRKITKGKSSRFEVLTVNEQRTLVALLGAGEIGIHLWTLMDFVFRQDFFDMHSGKSRTEMAVSRLKKFSIPITRDQHFYYATIPEELTIIMPMQRKDFTPLTFLQFALPLFSRQQLEQFFAIKRPTANKWIKEWLDLSLLRVQELQGKKPIYSHNFK